MQARELLRDMIVDGRLRAEQSLSEPLLAEEFGVSRTPLREALFQLEREGFVTSTRGRGFQVAPLRESMVREIYPLLGTLEGAAVLGIGPRERSDLTRLHRLNDALLEARDTAERYAGDREFHRELVAPCSNGRLLEALGRYRRLARRFDGASARGMVNLLASHAEHREILAAIEADELESARQLLERHWRAGVEIVVRWLAKRSEGRP